jgi:hypothetical protein
VEDVMSSAIIVLKDGTRVEVDAEDKLAHEYASGILKKVDSRLDDVRPLLQSICESINGAFDEIRKSINIQTVDIELGLSFEGEGNIYITKAKAGANLAIKFRLNESR